MKKIKVEGFDVEIERIEGGKFMVSVPKLPGCTIEVNKEEQARDSIARMIGSYMVELASRRPKKPNRGDDEPEGGHGRKIADPRKRR